MKLRNKKTGEIYTLSENLYIEYTQGGKIEVRAIIPGGNMSYYYDSLDKLNEDWEDVKEPLIKDEKIRKAVRAWAEANKEEELEVMGGCSVTAFKSLYNHTEIDFNCSWKLRDSVYTIEELCGEEG